MSDDNTDGKINPTGDEPKPAGKINPTGTGGGDTTDGKINPTGDDPDNK